MSVDRIKQLTVYVDLCVMEADIVKSEADIGLLIYLRANAVNSPSVVEIGLVTVSYKLYGNEGVHIVIGYLDKRVGTLCSNVGHSKSAEHIIGRCLYEVRLFCFYDVERNSLVNESICVNVQADALRAER